MSEENEWGQLEPIKIKKYAPKGKYDERNTLNDLTGTKWIAETKSVWFQKGLGKDHPHAQIELQHPAPFSFQDITRLILFFTKKGQHVLDPFCGVASTLKACALTGRKGTGIELIKKWVDLGRKRLKTEIPSADDQELIQGDSREVMPRFPENNFDFIVTSPPYWRILNKPIDHKTSERAEKGLALSYSEEERDLANIKDYNEFLFELQKVFSECYRTLKPGKYMAVIVSDFRHGSDFIPYHMDITKTVEETGFKLKGITMLVQHQKKLYPYGYPYAFVSNIHHQNILIFRKYNEKEESVHNLDSN